MKFALHVASTIASLAATTAVAFGQAVEPYTEAFPTDNANWADQASAPLDWIADGGADSGGYVTNTFNFVDSSGEGFPQILFRGQANLNSSNGAFVGDWLEGEIVQFSFSMRHDAPVPLTVFARFATPANFPSANVIFPDALEPGEWTQFTLDITPDNPLFIFSGGPELFFSVFGNMGNIQIGVEGDPLFGEDIDVVFDLDLVATEGESIPGDINGDGVVNIQDLLLLVQNFGDCPDGPCPADLNGDGVVDAHDLLMLLGMLTPGNPGGPFGGPGGPFGGPGGPH